MRKFVIFNQEAKTSYGEVAKTLKTSENAVKVAAHRLRERYQKALRKAVVETLLPGEDPSREIRGLMEDF